MRVSPCHTKSFHRGATWGLECCTHARMHICKSHMNLSPAAASRLAERKSAQKFKHADGVWGSAGLIPSSLYIFTARRGGGRLFKGFLMHTHPPPASISIDLYVKHNCGASVLLWIYIACVSFSLHTSAFSLTWRNSNMLVWHLLATSHTHKHAYTHTHTHTHTHTNKQVTVQTWANCWCSNGWNCNAAWRNCFVLTVFSLKQTTLHSSSLGRLSHRRVTFPQVCVCASECVCFCHLRHLTLQSHNEVCGTVFSLYRSSPWTCHWNANVHAYIKITPEMEQLHTLKANTHPHNSEARAQTHPRALLQNTLGLAKCCCQHRKRSQASFALALCSQHAQRRLSLASSPTGPTDAQRERGGGGGGCVRGCRWRMHTRAREMWDLWKSELLMQRIWDLK